MPFGIPSNSRSKQSSRSTGVSRGIFTARVRAVVLDDTTYPELYEKYGKEASLGLIAFERVSQPQLSNKVEALPVALPYLSGLNHYPVENEILTIIMGAGPEVSTDTNNISYYYLPPTNLWNNPHSNAIPNEVFAPNSTKPGTGVKNYQEATLGSPSRVATTPYTLNFKSGFEEKSTIFPLLPFAGDVSIQGRWGNSIRFGSTNKDKNKTNWSSEGTVGDPIILLSNGRFINSGEWTTLEDINTDSSSIYLTTSQKININSPVYINNSYNGQNAPEVPNQYTQPQIFLNSSRVGLFGLDSVIASAPKIHLSGETVNIDTTGPFTVYASRVNLGSGNPEELQPALKGDSTEALLKDILEVLTALTQACVTATGTVPIVSLQKFAAENLAKVQALNTSTIKSDDTFIV